MTAFEDIPVSNGPKIIDLEVEQELDERFSPERIGNLCTEFIEGGLGFDAREKLQDRPFLVAYIPADSPYADIPRSTETAVFSRAFSLPKAEIVRDYGKYDPASTFVAVIDASKTPPVSAAALRITDYQPELGFKDVNDLVADDPKNPWINEIKDVYFAQGESYDSDLAWQRLGKGVGVELKLEESHDIPSHASAPEYAGQHGGLNGASMLFYHACLRYALAHKKSNLVAIFDIPPFKNLQQFGEPFRTYQGLNPHKYGGPYDTIPAFCILEEGIQRVRQNDVNIGRAFIDGAMLDQNALLPNEHQPEQYSNEAVGLEPL